MSGYFTIGEMADAELVQAVDRAVTVGIVVGVPPRLEGGVLGGHHDFEGTQLRPQFGGKCGRHVGDAPPQAAHIGVTQSLAGDDDLARARVQVQGRNANERGFARSVGAEV